jgi:hypothetical protein
MLGGMADTLVGDKRAVSIASYNPPQQILRKVQQQKR